MVMCQSYAFFFFNDTATTEIYTLSLHDALPICNGDTFELVTHNNALVEVGDGRAAVRQQPERSEEHTSELQSQSNIVCRLLLEKKKPDVAVSCQRFSVMLCDYMVSDVGASSVPQ